MAAISGIGSGSGYYATHIVSGRRINSAADDAAGMTISQKLNNRANGHTQNAKNANEVKDALNIADGAYGTVTEYLQEIKRLSVKGSNGTLTKSDKQAIQNQIDQYLQGIDETANSTEYNTKQLINHDWELFAATNPDGSGFESELKSSTVDSLGLSGYSIMDDDFDMTRVDDALAKISSSRSNVGSSTNELDHSAAYSELASHALISADSNLADLDMAQAVSDQKKEELLEEYRTMMIRKQSGEELSLTNKLFGK